MKAVLLAAGRGTRLAPLTHTVPKILLPIAGRTLLAGQLRYMAAAGVTDVAINVHHHAGLVSSALEQHQPPPRVYAYVEPTLRGTAGALCAMAEFLDQPFVVLYGDVVTDADLRGLMSAHIGADAVATLGYHELPDVAGKGIVMVGDGGEVTHFVEKPTRRPIGPALVNAGIAVVEPIVLRLIDETTPDLARDIWPRLLANESRVIGVRLDGIVRDIGTPAALNAVEREIALGQLNWPPRLTPTTEGDGLRSRPR